jgi:hypothetical protein
MPRAELGASTYFVSVTPDDTNVLSYATRSLYVGTGGSLNVTASDNADEPILFENVSNGTTLDIAVGKVLSTGTTASNIIALV